MYVLRSRTPHAHELSQSRLNGHDASVSQTHGDPTSPGSIQHRAKSGGTRTQAKHSLLSQQLVALWNRQGLTLQERQRQIGSSRVLTHATEEHVACLQELIRNTDFSCQPRGGAPRPVSSMGHDSLLQEAFRPIRDTSNSSSSSIINNNYRGGHTAGNFAAPTAGGGGAPPSPYKYVALRQQLQQQHTPNILQLTPIQHSESPDRYLGGGSRPVSRHLNYMNYTNTSVGYNDSVISGYTTPGTSPSKEREAAAVVTQTQQRSEEVAGVSAPPTPEVGRPKPNNKEGRGAWRQYDDEVPTILPAVAEETTAVAPLTEEDQLRQQRGLKGPSKTTEMNARSQVKETRAAQQLEASELVHRTMVSDDALSQLDIMYLTHCHIQMSIESQLLDQQVTASRHHAGDDVSPYSKNGSSVPSFIYERTSQSVLLAGLPNEKIDRLLLLEKFHRLKLEQMALMGPSLMWEIFILGRAEGNQRSIIKREYNCWIEEIHETFSGFLNKFLDAKPLYRVVYTAFYRVEQEENSAWCFLDDAHIRKRGIIERCQPVSTCEREDRTLYKEIEAVERTELQDAYTEHFSVAIHLQQAREDCELETINQDEDYVRSYQEAEEVYARQMIQLQVVEGTVRNKMSELHSDKHSVLVKAEAVLTIVEDAKTQLRFLAEQTSVATHSQSVRFTLEINEVFEMRETSTRMVTMVEEATERCLIYLQLREARDRVQLQGLQDLEVIQMEHEKVHRTITHDEEALFFHIPHAVFVESATVLDNEYDEISERLLQEEQKAWYQIPVDLCVAQLQALEDHESNQREELNHVEATDHVETAVEETGAVCVVGLGVQAMKKQMTLYATVTLQSFGRRVIARARRTRLQKLQAVEALLQEEERAVAIVHRVVRIFRARLARHRALKAETARRGAQANAQERQYAAGVMSDTSRKFVERKEAKKIVGARRHEKMQTDRLLLVTSLADVVHNEAHHRHDVMMHQISSYMDLSSVWLAANTANASRPASPTTTRNDGHDNYCDESNPLHMDNSAPLVENFNSSVAGMSTTTGAGNNSSVHPAAPNSSAAAGGTDRPPAPDTSMASVTRNPHNDSLGHQPGATTGTSDEPLVGVDAEAAENQNLCSPAATGFAESSGMPVAPATSLASTSHTAEGWNTLSSPPPATSSPTDGCPPAIHGDTPPPASILHTPPPAPLLLDEEKDSKLASMHPEKENASRRIQSAGRHRKAIADVEERRSRSNSPAQLEALPNEADKEVATRRIQSAGRSRKAQADVEDRRSRSNSPSYAELREVTEAGTNEKEVATRRIQSAGRNRKAEADVEERRSRSSSPIHGARKEEESANTAAAPIPTAEREDASRRIQSAGRHRKAIADVEERRSRSSSPVHPRESSSPLLVVSEEKEGATRRIQSAGRNRKAQDDVEGRRSRSSSPAGDLGQPQ